MSFNKVILMGNLTREPELRQTRSGTSILSDSLAINESYTAQDGTRRDNASFVDITAFGRTAENIAKFFHKGSPILIEGRLRQESWTDKQSGQSRSKLVVVAERFEFVGGGKSDDEQPDRSEYARPQPAKPAQRELHEQMEDEDVPF
jgi:single-strand binding protein|nr:MAG TPA: Single strand binding protein [Caudoviricetes sp.]